MREGFRRGGKYRDFFDPGRHCVFKAAHIGRQRAVHHARFALDVGEDLGRAGHLRHPFGRNETAHFDVTEAGIGQGVNQLHLVGHADRAGFVLQAVAGADFNQAHMGG